MIRAARSSRGYTLLEVVVVAVISSVLLVLGMRWVFALSTASLRASSTEQTTQMTYALDQLEDDMRSASHCSPYNQDQPLRAMGPDSISVVSSREGLPLQVSWRLADGRLQRATVPCSEQGTATVPDADWKTLAVDVRGLVAVPEAQDALLAPVIAGEIQDDAEQYERCASGCELDAIRVELGSTVDGVRTVRTLPLG